MKPIRQQMQALVDTFAWMTGNDCKALDDDVPIHLVDLAYECQRSARIVASWKGIDLDAQIEARKKNPPVIDYAAMDEDRYDPEAIRQELRDPDLSDEDRLIHMNTRRSRRHGL